MMATRQNALSFIGSRIHRAQECHACLAKKINVTNIANVTPIGISCLSHHFMISLLMRAFKARPSHACPTYEADAVPDVAGKGE